MSIKVYASDRLFKLASNYVCTDMYLQTIAGS